MGPLQSCLFCSLTEYTHIYSNITKITILVVIEDTHIILHPYNCSYFLSPMMWS
jgi:hypothetical protein